jgi:hypothetical protein
MGVLLYITEICALLGYYGAWSGNTIPTFRDVGANFKRQKGQDFLTLEDGIDTLFRNVGMELPLYVP